MLFKISQWVTITAIMLLLTGLSAETIQEADDLYEQAMRAMNQMNDDSSKSVEAAVYLHEAKGIYTENEQWPRVREVNSYIFFCKKKMNLSELNTYVATLGRDRARTVRQTFSLMEDEVSSAISQEYAALGFSEAEAFAEHNRDSYLRIHMRYLEISERAIDTNPSLAIKASRRSSEALQSWVRKTTQAAKSSPVKNSPFTEPRQNLDLMGDPVGYSIPNKNTIKKVIKSLQETFAKRLKTPRGNGTPRALLKMAKESLDQPDYSYVYALEAARLSVHRNVNNASLLMESLDFLEKNFAISNFASMRLIFVGKQRSPIAKSVLTLFKDQNNAAANKAIGLSYCFIGDNWSQGIDLLEASADPLLQRLVAMERAHPNTSTQQKQLADEWYELSTDRAYKAYGLEILRHSRKWYLKAQSQASGISRDQIEKRLLQASLKLPVSGLEYVPIAKVKGSILKKSLWNKLKGFVVRVDASKGQNFTGITILKGQSIRVFPNIYDTWIVGGTNASYLGLNYFGASGESYGSMRVQVGNGPLLRPDSIIRGEGKVFIMCNSSGGGSMYDSGRGGSTSGSIRCKIARVK